MTQPPIKQMKLYTHVERVRRELEARGLNHLPRLDPGALENVDQLHYLGLAAIEAALDVLDLGPVKHVLDVGAGLGGPARVLAERAGCKVTAVELQADLNAMATELTERCGLASVVEHRCADIFDLTPEQDRFDALVSWLCFLHIDDKPALLAQCRRLLKPGALIYIEDFTLNSPPSSRESELLAQEVYCRSLVSSSDYAALLEQNSFKLLDQHDMTQAWTEFVRSRLCSFESGRDQFERFHGAKTYQALHHFYAAVVELFNGPALGGTRLVARAE